MAEMYERQRQRFLRLLCLSFTWCTIDCTWHSGSHRNIFLLFTFHLA